MKKVPVEFNNHMTKRQTILGFVYLPIHVFLLPLLLGRLLPEMDVAELNLLYFGISAVLVLLIFFSHLRAHFDNFLDRKGWCLLTILMTLGLDYVLSYAVTLVAMLLPMLGEENPNDMAVMDMLGAASGAVKACSIFLAPIVEEVLFRGVIFGSLRSRSRVWAYVLSIAIFALLHVWQYALAAADWTILLYVLQYIPVSFALCWCYERSGSIWCPIAFHMLINAMSFKAMEMMEQFM